MFALAEYNTGFKVLSTLAVQLMKFIAAQWIWSHCPGPTCLKIPSSNAFQQQCVSVLSKNHPEKAEGQRLASFDAKQQIIECTVMKNLNSDISHMG